MVRRCYRGLQRGTEGDKILGEVTWGYKCLQRGRRGYRGKKGYRKLQGVTGSYKGLQKVAKTYRK